jgi:hypothetical protein
MAITSTMGRGNGTSANGAPTRPPSRLAPNRRNRARIGLGAVVVALAALAAAVLYADVGHRRVVLAVAHEVDPGQAITNQDLREVRVSADPGLAPIAASERSAIVGQVADVRLVPGTLLTRAQLAKGPALSQGMALVGAVLKPGQFPIGLRVGDRVELIAATAAPTGGTDRGPSGTTTSPEATVAALERTSDSSDTVTASLLVSAVDAAALADAGATGRLELVVVGR